MRRLALPILLSAALLAGVEATTAKKGGEDPLVQAELAVPVQTVPCPPDAPPDPAELATKICQGKGPAVVLLVAPPAKPGVVSDPDTNSRLVEGYFQPASEDLCLAAKYFKVFRVEVKDPKAPVMVLFDGDGKPASVLKMSDNLGSKGTVLGRMSKTLKPKVVLEEMLSGWRDILKDLPKISNLQGRRKELSDAMSQGTANATTCGPVLKDLDAKVAKLMASVQERKDKLAPKP